MPTFSGAALATRVDFSALATETFLVATLATGAFLAAPRCAAAWALPAANGSQGKNAQYGQYGCRISWFEPDREPEAGGFRNCKFFRATVPRRLHRLDSGSSGNRTSLMCVQSLPVLNRRLLFKIMGYFKYLKFFVNDFFATFTSLMPLRPGARRSGALHTQKAGKLGSGGSWHPDTPTPSTSGCKPVRKADRRAVPIRSCALHQRRAGRASGHAATPRDGGSQDSRPVAGKAQSPGSRSASGECRWRVAAGVNAPTVALIRSSRSRSIARPSRKMLDNALPATWAG